MKNGISRPMKCWEIRICVHALGFLGKQPGVFTGVGL